MTWSLHMLDARGRLTAITADLRAAIAGAQALVEAVAPALDLDLVVRATDQPMPEALAVSGMAPGPGRIELAVDLGQLADRQKLHDGVLRTLAHEYHHALRWDGPGYGRSLGEALASEGLAQRFLHEVMVCPPEPWESALADDAFAPAARQGLSRFDDTGYSHSDWFFGTGDMPVWAGYALGLLMVDCHLVEHPGATALSLADAPAQTFRPALQVIAQ